MGNADDRLAPANTVGVRAIAAATVGNLLEIYDFISYGMFAVPISAAFFPAGNEYVSLILTFVTFGMGFLARPLGALVIGSYADRHGRKGAFSVTILLMAIGTAVIAFCPTYRSIGLAAPVLITLGRLLQGFSAGAEVGGAVAILIENAPPERRGFFSALQQLSQGCAVLATGIVGVGMTVAFSQAEIMAGAWRIVFMIGLLIAPVGVYIRLRIDETPEFLLERKTRKERLTPGMLLRHVYPIFIGVLIMILWTVATYVSNYFTTYSVREIHLSLQDSYIGQISYGIVMLMVCPMAGRLSDAIGRVRCLLFGAIGIGGVAYPAFWFLIHHPGLGSLCLAQSVIALFLALYASTASTVLGELFPTAVRATGVSLAYSFGVTIFGGFTPAIVTALLGYSGNKLSIAYYLIGAALISAVPILLLDRRRPLERINR
ncbi:MFS transporter [Telmatospirillum sp.]|uniref:MFS transporter n=1 Tax=Telmatospirillum sp. TaxID=2079197 RepID=UPI002844F035|nr:MFS transporter [Telmatospirillum sp.]MDR3440360.1 MFS transporter [Telmatospirillum sp.]